MNSLLTLKLILRVIIKKCVFRTVAQRRVEIMPTLEQITQRFLTWMSCAIISIVMVVQVGPGATPTRSHSSPQQEQQAEARLEDETPNTTTSGAHFFSTEPSEEEEVEAPTSLDPQTAQEESRPPAHPFLGSTSARGPPDASPHHLTHPDPRRAIISLLFDRGPPLLTA